MSEPRHTPTGEEPGGTEHEDLAPFVGVPGPGGERPGEAPDDGALASFMAGLSSGEAEPLPAPLPDEGLDMSRFVSTRPAPQEALRRRSRPSGRHRRRRRRQATMVAIAVAAALLVAVASILLLG